MSERYRPLTIRFQKRWHGWLFVLGSFAAVIMLERWNFGMMRKYQLVDIDTSFGIGLLVCVLVTATLCWFFVWPSGRLAWRLKSSVAAGVALTALAGIGGYYQLNAVLDKARGNPHSYVIENLDCRRRRRHPAEIWLRPVSQDDTPIRLEVLQSMCRSTLPGDSVFVEVRPGFFGSRWVASYAVVRRKH